MQYGLFTSGYQQMELERAFSDAVAFGYDYIELWGGRPHAFAPDLLTGDGAEVRRLIDRYAMPVTVYTPEHNAYPYNYMLGSETQWEDSMSYLTLCMRAAREIGAKYTLISVGHGGCMPQVSRHARLLRSLRRLVREAERLSHTLLLETLTPYESNTCTTLEDLITVLDEVDSPALMGMCDVVAPFSQGEDPVDYARKLGDRMCHLHLVDSDGQSETHLIPGDGVMPLDSIVDEMRHAGYDGTATIELVTNYIHAPSEAACLALKRGKQL